MDVKQNDKITTPAEALKAAAVEAAQCDYPRSAPTDAEAAAYDAMAERIHDAIRALSARIAPPVMSVETVAAAIWRMGLGKLRPNNQWPDDVRGGSHDLFRQYARAAIIAMGGVPDDAEGAR